MSFDRYQARFDAADPSSNAGNQFPVGKYPKLRVEMIKMHQGREGDDFFIVEFAVLESDNATKPAGATGSWVLNMKKDMSVGDVKAFLGILNGIQESARIKSEITTQVVNLALSPSQPMRGRLISLEVQDKEMKKRGSQGEVLYFPKHIWRTCEGQGAFIAPAPAPAPAPAAPPPPPPLPGIPAPVPVPVQFPPSGWLAHPSAPGWFYNQATSEQLTDVDLRNRFGIL